MPDSGRADYDRLIQFRQLEPGEPFFFIRARDEVSGPTVRAWAALAHRAGAPAAIIESALQQADRLDAWRPKQLPDADHLGAAERQDLEHQLSRRAWNYRIAHAPNEAILLAEQRGAQAVTNRERHADALLLDLVDALAPIVRTSGATAEQTDRATQALRRIVEDLERRGVIPNGVLAMPPAANDAEAVSG